MGGKTGITWTEATWNPIVGCSVVSPACTNCYAMAQADRIQRMAAGAGKISHYAGTTETASNGKPVWTGVLKQAPEHILTAPLRWKKPRKIFVNSMSDLFHENVPDEWIDRVFAVMALAPHHTFQILTKRPARLRAYLEAGDCGLSIASASVDVPFPGDLARVPSIPLKNVWLGVTAEDQTRADERIPDLLATPAAERFVSIEPMLGPVDLSEYLGVELLELFTGPHWTERTCGVSDLDWVICGTESGSGARTMHIDWARSLRDQCDAAGVAFFMKQMTIDGRLVKDAGQFPADLRVQQFPDWEAS